MKDEIVYRQESSLYPAGWYVGEYRFDSDEDAEQFIENKDAFEDAFMKAADNVLAGRKSVSE